MNFGQLGGGEWVTDFGRRALAGGLGLGWEAGWLAGRRWDASLTRVGGASLRREVPLSDGAVEIAVGIVK